VVRNAGAKPLGATVIGVSHSNDLAVIRVHSGADTLTPARFGNSADVKIGEFVLAMGDPLGLSDSVTQGIVSSADRESPGAAYRRRPDGHPGQRGHQPRQLRWRPSERQRTHKWPSFSALASGQSQGIQPTVTRPGPHGRLVACGRVAPQEGRSGTAPAEAPVGYRYTRTG
jgi:Trypsin-like peptidase domain